MYHEINIPGILKEIRTRAGRQNLTIALEDQFKPRTDGTTLYLPRPLPTWSRDEWTVWWFTLEHELGHNDADMRDVFAMAKEKNLNLQSFLGTIINQLDDHRQEYHNIDQYAGRKMRLCNGRARFCLTNKMDIGNSPDEHRQAMETLFVWDTIIRESWMQTMLGIGDMFTTMLKPNQLEWLDKLADGDYEKILKSGIDAYEEYDLALRIIKEVFNFDPDQEEQDSKQPSEGKGEAEGESGDGKGEDVADGESEGEDGGDEEGEGRVKKVKYSDLLAHQHEQEDGYHNPTGPLEIEYDYNSGDYELVPEDTYKIIDYTDGRAISNRADRHIKAIPEDVGLALSNKVKRLIQVNAISSYQHGKKRGKVSARNVSRSALTNSGEYQRKIFKNKITNDILNTAVSVVVDLSGSMSGSKVEHATMAAMMLNDAIGKLSVPLEIYGFSDLDTAPVHCLFKTFDQRVQTSRLRDCFADSLIHTMDGNSDGESILWGYNRLIKRREKRKIMIVLSDGSPAGYRGDCDAYTKIVVDNIERVGIVEIYGIGIMHKNVERLYKQHEVIRKPEELEEKLLGIVKRKML